MAKPDSHLHDPRPEYIRSLIIKSGLTQSEAAERIGVSGRMMRYYLSEDDRSTLAPYVVQYALECL